MPEALEKPRPKVGVAAVIHDRSGKIILGKRKGSHGAGEMACPGGHIEHGESFADCAEREVLEETGLKVGDVKFITATNDIMGEGKHYITIFVECVIVGEDKEPELMEPDKCEGWAWVDWSQMWAWSKKQAEIEDRGKAGEQGEEVKMFMPLVNLYRQYPHLEAYLGT